MKNLYADPAHAETVKKLKEEMYRLKKELKDENQFENETAEGRRGRAAEEATRLTTADRQDACAAVTVEDLIRISVGRNSS